MSKNEELEKEFQSLKIEPSDELLEYLGKKIDEIQSILDQDEERGKRRIRAVENQLQTVEKLFREEIEKQRKLLVELEKKNEIYSKENLQLYERKTNEINNFYTNKFRREAFMKFHEYLEQFQNRSTIFSLLPEISITRSDICDLFSSKKKSVSPPPPSVVVPPVEPKNNVNQINIEDSKDSSRKNLYNNFVDKAERRGKKQIEKQRFDGVDENITEENQNENENETLQIHSEFGSASKKHNERLNENFVQTSTENKPKAKFFSARLTALMKPSSSFSEEKSFRPIDSSTHRSMPFPEPTLDMIQSYNYDRHKSVLLVCSPDYFLLFRHRLNRSDKWEFDSIARFTNISKRIDWSDGLIISMCHIQNNQFVIFTKHSLIVFDLEENRTIRSLILRSGNEQDYESVEDPYDDVQRGIGTSFRSSIYYLYLNAKSNWALVEVSLPHYSVLPEQNLSSLIRDAIRFIHFNINEKSMSFLVELSNHSYAVVIYLSQNLKSKPDRIIQLNDAQRPLKIHSIKSPYSDEYLYVVNDPTANLLHILDNERYLKSYEITVHSMDFIPQNVELILITDQSISSIDFSEEIYWKK